MVVWNKPSHNFLKLNTNASVVSIWAYEGGLLQTHEEKLVFAFYKEFGEVDLLTVEALSLVWGLQFCQEKGVEDFEVEVDS